MTGNISEKQYYEAVVEQSFILDGILCWPDGDKNTLFNQEIELYLFDSNALDTTKEIEFSSWEDMLDKQISFTKSDSKLGYFRFPACNGITKGLDKLGDERSFLIAARNCIILIPWWTDKVINISGGGILKIKVRKEEISYYEIKGKKEKITHKKIGYRWYYQRYPKPNGEMEPWNLKHMLIPGLGTDLEEYWWKLWSGEEQSSADTDTIHPYIKAFYIIPFAKYLESGNWNVSGFEFEDVVINMFNSPETPAEYRIYPSIVLDCKKYPGDDVKDIYNHTLVDFYSFGAKYNGEENKLIKFAYNQDGSCKQVPLGKGVCYNKDGTSRIKEFEYSYDSSNNEKTKLELYSPFKPQYTQNTPPFGKENPIDQYDSNTPPKPNNVLYSPLEHISGAILKDDKLLMYTPYKKVNSGVIPFWPGEGYDNGNNSVSFTHEYYSKGFTGGRMKDARNGNVLHKGLDMHNWLKETDKQGAANHAMCYGQYTYTHTTGIGGNYVTLSLRFPDGTRGSIYYVHMHSKSPAIKDGQFVFPNQFLAFSGDSGNAKGDPKNTSVTSKHTHLTLVINGNKRNPAKIFNNKIDDELENVLTSTQLEDYRKNKHPVISGKVELPDGKAAANVKIKVYDSEINNSENKEEKKLYSISHTFGNGKYTVPAPPTYIDIEFSLNGYKTEKREKILISLKEDEQAEEIIDVTLEEETSP